jgi:hypothetical protein
LPPIFKLLLFQLGKIEKIFCRWEFQSAGALGNKPHVHCGLTLKDEPIEHTLHRIKCVLGGFIGSVEHGTSWSALNQNGLIDETFLYGDLNELQEIQRHDCQKANNRCHKRINDEGQTVCRVPVHPPSNQYSYEEIPMTFDEQATDILSKLELAEKQADGKIKLHPDLQGGRWHYPSDGMKDRVIPTVPLLFALFKSCTNVQVCHYDVKAT